MSDRHPRTPEMALIRRRREDAKLSVRRAAAAAGKSDTWWRWKESGYRPTPLGNAPEDADDDALAVMAHVVRASPGELRGVGRDGAADALAALEKRAEVEAQQDAADARIMVDAAGARGLTARQRAALEGVIIDALREMRRT